MFIIWTLVHLVHCEKEPFLPVSLKSFPAAQDCSDLSC